MSEPKYTSEHVKHWHRAISHLDSAKKQLEEAMTELEIVEASFARHLAPNDMKFGEEIGVWVKVGFRQEQVITVKRVQPGNFVIQKRGNVKQTSG